MKKIIIYSTFLFLIFISFKCAVEDSFPKNDRIDMETYLNKFNGDKLEHNKGILSHGKILFDVIEGKKAIVVVEDDSNVEHSAYYYQSDNGELPDMELESGSILFLRNSIYIQNLRTNDVYKVALGDDKSTPFKNVSFISSVEAFGIGATKAIIAQENQRVEDPMSFSEGSCVCKTNGINHGCSSGGEGATACACCGCSVTCGSGKYACCNS